MAELIRKDKLIDWTYRVPQYYDSMNDRTDMRDFINGLPTMSEAEIRASAYERFSIEAVRQFIKFDEEHDFISIGVCLDIISKVAEQLKEKQ